MMSRDNWRMWPLEWITHIIETCFHLYVHEIEKKKTHCFCFPDNCLFSAIWIYSLPVKHYHECGIRKITIFWDRKQTYIYTNIYIFFLLLLLVVETKLIRLCFSSPETKNVWSQSILQHMAEVIFFYPEFVSNMNLWKHWTKEIGYILTIREDLEVLFTVFLNT